MEIVYRVIQIGFAVLLCGAGLIGVIALLSPRMFVAVSMYGNEVINGKGVQYKDSWINIDEVIHSHSRVFGSFVTGITGFVWLVSSHGPEAYSKSSMLLVVIISLVTGIGAIMYMRWQTRAIETHSTEAHTDALTGLYNRRMFDVELSRRLAQRQRQNMPVCLMIFDIDDFKTINDAYGHQVGDETLRHVAGVMTEHARESDIAARIGGDEFAVILPGSKLDESSHSASRLAARIREYKLGSDDDRHALTVSIGIAEADPDDDTISLLRRADAVLYAAKAAGKNCCYRQGVPEPAVPTPC